MEEVTSTNDATLSVDDSVDALKAELKRKEEEVEILQKELLKCKRQCEKTATYNDDLRKQVEKLSDLLNQRCVKNQKSVHIQVNASEIDDAYANGNWLAASEKANLSVADCVREAAEEVTRQSGYVFDETSGYYYDSSSGYYYDAEQSLYYDANTGIYFFYNPESKKYEFHSQIDVSQLKESQNTLDENVEEVEECKPTSKHRKTKKHKDTTEDDSTYNEKRRSKKFKTMISGGKKSVLTESDNGSNDVDEDDEDDDNYNNNDHDDDDRKARRYVKTKHKKKKRAKERKKKMIESGSDKNSSVEEGECSDSNDDDDDERYKVKEVSDDELADETIQDVGSQWPPCIRVIVIDTSITKLTVGTLFLVTCNGAMIGREKSCDICIPDIEVSKAHAEFTFLESGNHYVVKDLGSQNGTYLNGVKMSEAKQPSEQMIINHDDIVEVGKTKLLLHIHKGSETCDNCEPGQVQAIYAALNPNKKEIKILSKEEKEQERKLALKQIKRKFGLVASAYENKGVDVSSAGYKDRAKERRHTKGSDNPYEKTEMASVEKAISVDNKGFKMMQKMGWESGQLLGKSQLGIAEPIPLDGQTSKAGLGSSGVATHVASLTPEELKRKDNWMKARDRFQNIERNHEMPKSPSAQDSSLDDVL